MKRIAIIVALMLAAVPMWAQQNELKCFIRDTPGELTNIRNAPRGKVVAKVDALDPIQVTVLVQDGKWWRIKDATLSQYGEPSKIDAPEAWIHCSVLALGTDDSDGQPRVLLAEPRSGAKRVGTIQEHNAVLRPLDVSKDGLWVKVQWQQLTGWIEVKDTRDDCMEPGSGYDFATLSVYTRPGEAITLQTGPASGVPAFRLQPGHFYEFSIAHPRDGWWQLVGQSVFRDDEDEVFLEVESWIPADAVCMTAVNPDKKPCIPLLKRPEEGAAQLGTLAPGTVVHPVAVAEDHLWAKVYVDGKPSQTGWCSVFFLCWSYNGHCFGQ